MKVVNLNLDSIDKVKRFVNIVAKYDCDLDLVSGRYVVDAKSIMGIFSLDLSKPIELNIHATSEEECAAIEEELSPFILSETEED